MAAARAAALHMPFHVRLCRSRAAASTPQARREYMRQTLRPLGRSGLVYKFVIGTRGSMPSALPSARAARRLELSLSRENGSGGRLSGELARHGDLTLLASARDGAKAYTSEKVLLWLLHARREYPAALFVGKVDPDVSITLTLTPTPTLTLTATLTLTLTRSTRTRSSSGRGCGRCSRRRTRRAAARSYW